jgi:hypothetical protein
MTLPVSLNCNNINVMSMYVPVYIVCVFCQKSPGLDINICPIPVKTDVGQVDLVSWLSDGTSEKMTVLSFGGYFL